VRLIVCGQTMVGRNLPRDGFLPFVLVSLIKPTSYEKGRQLRVHARRGNLVPADLKRLNIDPLDRYRAGSQADQRKSAHEGHRETLGTGGGASLKFSKVVCGR